MVLPIPNLLVSGLSDDALKLVSFIKRLNLHNKKGIRVHIGINAFLIGLLMGIIVFFSPIRQNDSLIYFIWSTGTIGYYRISLLPVAYAALTIALASVGHIEDRIVGAFKNMKKSIHFEKTKILTFARKKSNFIFSRKSYLFAAIFSIAVFTPEGIEIVGTRLIYVNWWAATYFIVLYFTILFFIGLSIWFLLGSIYCSLSIWRNCLKNDLYSRNFGSRRFDWRLNSWRLKLGGLKPLADLIKRIMIFYIVFATIALIVAFGFRFWLYLLGLVIIIIAGTCILSVASITLHRAIIHGKKILFDINKRITKNNLTFLMRDLYISHIPEWPIDLRDFGKLILSALIGSIPLLLKLMFGY